MGVIAAEIARAQRSAWVPVSKWHVGIDLGQAQDSTALAAIESISHEQRHAKGHPFYDEDDATRASRPPEVMHVRALERLPLGTSYVQQAQEIGQRLADPRLAGARVFIDSTGVGRAVADLFREAGVAFTGVMITGGSSETQSGLYLHVAKIELISTLQAAMNNRTLRVSPRLPEAKAFARELAQFRVNVTAAGHAQFGARVGAHDDLVLAVALAVYGAVRGRRNRVKVASLHV